MIGPYPFVGIKEVRERRDTLRLKLIDGEDLEAKRKTSPFIVLDAAIAT